ncbi:MAG: hypothetical protein AB7V50_09690 [Vampirovibrionia bacterium]
MRTYSLLISFLIIFITTGCALTGGSKSNYGANLKKPDGNYNNATQIPVQPPVPDINSSKTDTPLENLFKTFYAPYSTLYTACLRAIENMNLSLTSFNSTTGLIEFKNIQGETLALKISPDKEYNSRSSVKLFAKSGSRKFNQNFINTLFESINYQLNAKY